MPLSEYARSEYEEDSEFEISEEEDGSDQPPLEPNRQPNTPLIEKSRLEILDDTLSNPSLASPNGNHPTRSTNSSMISDSNSLNFINHVDMVINKVKSLEHDPNWSRVLKHRTGVQVFAQKHAKAVGKEKVVPIYKGVGLIRGYSPASVFAVIGCSKLWDEWYEDGNLVDNLSDQISLTYMCMKAGLGTRPRDLSLVEKVEAMTDGSIYFCASSVDTPRVPIIPGRNRAHIELNAWVLQPVMLPPSTSGASTTGTKVTYYLQVNIKTFVAEAITQRYLTRRPLCITKIDAYLQKHGSPSTQLEDNVESYPHQGGTRRSYSRNYMSLKQIDFPKEHSHDNAPSSAPNTLMSRGIRSHLSSIGSFGQKSRHRLPASISVPSLNSTDQQLRKASITLQTDKVTPLGSPNGMYQAPLLIDHLKPNQESLGWKSITQTLKCFNTYTHESDGNHKDWKIVEISENSVRMLLNSHISRLPEIRQQEDDLFKLPMVKSEAIVNTREDSPNSQPITKGQVLLTILSNLAQQIWDENFVGYCKFGDPTHHHQLLLSTDNGFDQGTHLGTMRAIYPHIQDDSFFCFDQLVVRQPSVSLLGNQGSMDDSKIIVINHSVEDEAGYLVQLEKNFQNRDQPKVNSILREMVEKKLLSKIDVEGWIIQSGDGENSANQIQIIHLSALELNLKNQQQQQLQSNSHSTSHPISLPEFLTKLISSNIASRPLQVCKFISQFGFAPGFVKWMNGEIQYLGEHNQQISADGNNNRISAGGIKFGEVEWKFKVKKESDPITKTTEIPSIKVSPISIQTCWFQWSERMYPNGIELVLDPPNVAEVKLASDMHNTIQFNWKNGDDSFKDTGIKLKAKQIKPMVDGQINHSPQPKVIFNGNQLVETIALQIVQSKKKDDSVRRRKKRVTSTAQSITAGGNKDGSHDANDKQLDKSASNPSGSSSQPNQVNEQQSSTTTSSDSTKISKTNNSKQKDGKSNIEKHGLFVEPNVAIIINKHIHFTRPQVAFFVVCIGAAYLYGRLG